MRSQKDLMVQTADLHPAKSNNGMQRTRNQHVSHARLVAGGGSCAPLMPSVRVVKGRDSYRRIDSQISHPTKSLSSSAVGRAVRATSSRHFKAATAVACFMHVSQS